MTSPHPHQPPTHPESQRNAPLSYGIPPRQPSYHSETSSSANRKRRVVVMAHEENRQSFTQSSPNHTSLSPSNSNRMSASVIYQPRRSISEIVDTPAVMPNWQSDDRVTKCPVCGQEFSLFFRKHHCRKCGRVVCGDCSRHRITLPLRYIVQPPWVDLHIADARSAESVRVCNPCVPDPWTPSSPSQHHESPRPIANHRYSMPPSPSTHRIQGQVYIPAQGGPRRSVDASSRTNRNSAHIFTNPLAPFYQPQSVPTPTYQRSHRYSATPEIPARRNHPLPPPPDLEHDSESAPVQPPPRQPRRIVKEEDECPVCGVELAPGQELREQHITSCISNRFGNLDPSRSTPTSTTPDGLATEAGASSQTPPQSNRARAQSYRSRGLYSYKATEKDCTDNDGQEQECPICFEEFQPGDAMGRLECLCKFHHSCIREWWVRKGPGMCPVHASHE